MYVRLTPRQLTKLKDFLKSVSLKAYDIQTYNEIGKALDSPIDEKDKKDPNYIYQSDVDSVLMENEKIC